MKRKCIEKRSYGTLDAVQSVIINAYCNSGLELYYYECPLYLDFHLTKKKHKDQFRFRLKAIQVHLKSWFRGRKTAKCIMAEALNTMYKHLKTAKDTEKTY